MPELDFFVSYNQADKERADWIARVLEEFGYTAFIQARDIRPGSNFVLEMDRATSEADRVIAVLSPDYLAAPYPQSEWTAAFANGKLLPVRVRECELKGLLGAVAYIDLVGLDEDAAKKALVAGVQYTGPERARGRRTRDAVGRPTADASIGSMKGVTAFCSYSHRDEKLMRKLERHLNLLQREGCIRTWHDRMITAGSEWKEEIDASLGAADLILLLISADFLASDYCYGVEMKKALERHRTGNARVVPIILRPVDWKGSQFGKLQALPKDGKPITTWSNPDAAFVNIVQGIRKVLEDISRA